MTQADLFCLKWNNHNSNISNVISSLFSEEKFCDVTVGSEGQFLRAHKIVLIACSDYFQNLLAHILPSQHPIFILEGVKFCDLKAIIDYMYFGQVSVGHNQLQSVLKSSETLRVKSLGDVSCQLKDITSCVTRNTSLNESEGDGVKNDVKLNCPTVKRKLENTITGKICLFLDQTTRSKGGFLQCVLLS